MSSSVAAPVSDSHDRRFSPKTSFWFFALRFLLLHLVCLGAIWTGISWVDVALCAALYVMRMFFVTAGYHRYFAHRTFKLGRFWQFIFAFMAQSSGQKSAIWWAAHHRHHHKHSDTEQDIHSVKHGGFFWAHMAWIFDVSNQDTDMSRVKDLTKYPELMFLHRFENVSFILLAVAVALVFGWSGLFFGFFLSTVLCWHATFAINSLAHVLGSRRYDTSDESRNNWLLALLTLGEGWHNNHHHFQASANQGFFWWEVDISFYILWAMSKVGIVKDLRRAPHHVVHQLPHPRASERLSNHAA